MPMRTVLPTVVMGIGIMLGVGAAGCSLENKSKLGAEAQKNIAITQDQLRLQVRAMVDPMCGQVEQSADAIIAGTTDRDVQLAALSWKIDAVPALREALYQPEPIIAGVDTLALCNQMADYFETGAGRQALGPAASAQAAATCRQMADAIDKSMVSATISGDIPKARAVAKKWAAEHPIRHSISDRERLLVRSKDGEAAEALTAGQAISDVTTTMDDLNRKLDVYSKQLFRQGRWEAERFKMQTVAELRVDEAIPLAERAVKSAEQAVATVDRLAPAVERSLAVAESAPKLVASERDIVIKTAHAEVADALKFAHEERIAALEQVGKERRMALEQLNETIIQQRTQVVADAGKITAREIDYAVRRVTWLVAIVFAAGVALALLGAFFARWLLLRRAT
jgi:hypothetical protein